MVIFAEYSEATVLAVGACPIRKIRDEMDALSKNVCNCLYVTLDGGNSRLVTKVCACACVSLETKIAPESKNNAVIAFGLS